VFGHIAPAKFLSGLNAEIKDTLKTDPGPIIKAVKDEVGKIEESGSDLVKDAPSEGHLELCSSVLAAYNTLLPTLGDRESTVNFISRAMMRGVNTWSMRASLGLMLYVCRNNPDRLRDIFGWLMKQYGATFKWTSPHKEDELSDSFSVEIQRCFYFEFFKSRDVPFLTPILCQLDSLWFDSVDPQKHGFFFDKSRYKTQGYGARVCVFPIVQQKKGG
jgi:hypothetical protein